jgi:hypothetical protein
MSKKIQEVAVPPVSVGPPDGFRELTEVEGLEFQNLTLRLSNAYERRMRWSAEIDVATNNERAAKNEISALEVVAKQMDVKLGVVDAQKDIVRVDGRVYVRKQVPFAEQPLPKCEITVKPGPT